jgi:hypothetical protein
VGRILPEVAGIPPDVGDLHGDVWSLLREQCILWRVFISDLPSLLSMLATLTTWGVDFVSWLWDLSSLLSVFLNYCLRRPLEGVLGDVVGLLQGFVVHLRDVGRNLQDVVGIPPGVMDLAKERFFARFNPSTQVGKRPCSFMSAEKGMLQKVIHDGGLWRVFISDLPSFLSMLATLTTWEVDFVSW